MFNNRSYRLLSSSTGFAHNPSKFEKTLCQTPKRKKKREQNAEGSQDVKMEEVEFETPQNKPKSPKQLSDPKQPKHATEFRNLYEFLN